LWPQNAQFVADFDCPLAWIGGRESVCVCVCCLLWGIKPRPKWSPNAFCLWLCLLSNYREWGINRKKRARGGDTKNCLRGNDSPTIELPDARSQLEPRPDPIPTPPPFPPWASSSSHECIQLHSALSELANLFSSHNWLSALFYCGASDGNSDPEEVGL